MPDIVVVPVLSHNLLVQWHLFLMARDGVRFFSAKNVRHSDDLEVCALGPGQDDSSREMPAIVEPESHNGTELDPNSAQNGRRPARSVMTPIAKALGRPPVRPAFLTRTSATRAGAGRAGSAIARRKTVLLVGG
jgi:hypothetical protein